MPMIPALLLILAAVAYRIVTGFFDHSGSIGLLELRAARRDRTLRGCLFPAEIQVHGAARSRFFISDRGAQRSLRRFASWSVDCSAATSASRLSAGLACSCKIAPSWKTLLPASLAASLIFYVITNAFSWLSDPGYAKNFAGLIQALTVGLPQYSATPTWMFFRNSLVSDLLFTVLFVLCMNFGRSSRDRAGAPRASVLPLRLRPACSRRSNATKSKCSR